MVNQLIPMDNHNSQGSIRYNLPDIRVVSKLFYWRVTTRGLLYVTDTGPHAEIDRTRERFLSSSPFQDDLLHFWAIGPVSNLTVLLQLSCR
jgi:hypothetical protein